MIILDQLLVVIATITTYSFASKRIIKLETVQSFGGLDGLGCALSDLQKSSGVEFDTLTSMCNKLPKNWFSKPTLKPNSDYYKFAQLEYIVSENKSKDAPIPSVLVPGGAAIVYMETTSTPMVGLGFVIDFVSTEFLASQYIGDVALHNKLYPHLYILDTRVNNNWGTQEITTNPFQQIETSYKIEFLFTNSTVEISIGDQHFYSYTHRTSLHSYQRVIVPESDYIVCKRMLFIYQ